MAKLTRMPSEKVIDGFKKTIDFYIHDGVPCARKWPRKVGSKRSPAVIAQWPAFSYAATTWGYLSPTIQEAYQRMASGTNLSGRDLYTKSFITSIFRPGQWD